MKAFEIKINGEKEIVSGESILKAIDYYCYTVGYDISGLAEQADDVTEVPESSWDSIIIRNTDKEEGEPDTYTLREMMDGVTQPCFISSTAY